LITAAIVELNADETNAHFSELTATRKAPLLAQYR
jgi:hypothetical protein